MQSAITIEDVDRALEARDRDLWRIVVDLAQSADPDEPVRDGALTVSGLRAKHRSRRFKGLDPEVRRQERMRDFAQLEAEDAEVAPPPRWWLFRVLEELHHDGSPWARDQLVRALQGLPLRYGPWRAVKRLFKASEIAGDWEIYAAIAARLDIEYTSWRLSGDVSRATLRYLVRRAWRTLRRVGERMPSAYPDRAVEILRHYGDRVPWQRTWIANHILCHHLPNAYNRNRFLRSIRRGRIDLAQRAFPAAWRRTPRPLFGLLERAKADLIRQFAIEALKTDFRTQLRDVEVAWVVRLVRARSAVVDDFVVWLLDNVPRFEPTAFRTLGLHDSVVELLDSDAGEAAGWAARYCRTHARDLGLERLVRLANSPQEPVRTLVRDLLRDRDPRTGVGLHAWGELLGTRYGHELAVEAIREHFGPAELTLDWFRERMVAEVGTVVEFAFAQIDRTHPPGRVAMSFWADVLDAERVSHATVRGLDTALRERPVAEIGAERLRRALVNPVPRGLVQAWVADGKLSPAVLGIDFLKALAYPPTWRDSPVRAALVASGREWALDLPFDEALGEWAIDQIDVPRTFSGAEVGAQWLLDMVQTTEGEFADFAEDTLVTGFAPGDLAPDPASGGAPLAGAQRVFEWLVSDGPADAPLRRFARRYLEHHHPVLHDQGGLGELAAELRLPAGFVTLERATQLLSDDRTAVRSLGIAFLRADLVALGAGLPDVLSWAELPHADVFAFVTEALTAPDKLEFRRYRLDPSGFAADDVYRLCDSLDPATRGLGLTLLALHPRLAVPSELYRLTESPDRRVVAFAVRQLWARYRHRPHSDAWSPADGSPLPGPDEEFAEPDDIRGFLRRSLFTIPPARPEKEAGRAKVPSDSEGRPPRVSARTAKLALIEVCRDLAVEDRAFARRVVPVFQEFLRSRGKSESAACLVALTRIRHRWRDGGRAPRGDR
ncbi:MAG: hypothetical protein AAF602_16835 [Myxococcota bacterium]